MKLEAARLVTGASGGIGRDRAASAGGAQVLLVDRDAAALARVHHRVRGRSVHAHVADSRSARPRRALRSRRQWHGGINVLINNAGVESFALYEDDSGEIDHVRRQLLAPMQLCGALLPSQPRAGGDRQHRLGVRRHRLSGLRRVLRDQVCAARVH